MRSLTNRLGASRIRWPFCKTAWRGRIQVLNWFSGNSCSSLPKHKAHNDDVEVKFLPTHPLSIYLFFCCVNTNTLQLSVYAKRSRLSTGNKWRIVIHKIDECPLKSWQKHWVDLRVGTPHIKLSIFGYELDKNETNISTKRDQKKAHPRISRPHA